MHRPALFILLLIVTIAPLAAQPVHRPLQIPTRDGRTLAADLYSTDTTVARPVILVQTPYNKNFYRIAANLPPQAGGRSFPWDTAHYNVVVLDWRGYYGSLGAAVAGYDRGLDGYDAVEWIATQRWSDGKVGTWGPSALGLIQYQTARHHPPHLLCAVPLVKDFKTKYSDYYYGGEYRKEHVETLAAIGFVSPATILSRPTYDLVWSTVEANTDYADEIAIPMLLISGWFDHFPDDVIRAFEDLRAGSDPSVRDRHRLVMGPWLHSGIGAVEQGALSYPNAAALPDSVTLAFFDRHLRGIDNDFERTPFVQYYQMGDERWRSAESWSGHVRAGDTLALHVTHDGLRPEPESGVFEALVTSDPRDPAPSLGGSRFPQPGEDVPIGPQDLRPVESRGDVMVFETPVLDEDLAVVGAPYVELYVSSSTPDADIAVRLTDVHPDGRSMIMAQGIQRLRFRNGLRPQDTAAMQAGEIARVRVQLQNLALTWKAGHRLRIVVSGADYPHFERNLNTGGRLYGGGDTLVATIAIKGSMQHPSRLVLPVPAGTSGIDDESGSDLLAALPSVIDGIVPFRFELAGRSHMTITLHDMLGRRVAAVLDETLDAGEHQRNLDVGTLARGAYVVSMAVDGRQQSRVVMVR